jgi:hypothetical protein
MVRQLLCMLTASITLGISVVFKVEIQSQIFLKRRKGKEYNHCSGSFFVCGWGLASWFCFLLGRRVFLDYLCTVFLGYHHDFAFYSGHEYFQITYVVLKGFDTFSSRSLSTWNDTLNCTYPLVSILQLVYKIQLYTCRISAVLSCKQALTARRYVYLVGDTVGVFISSNQFKNRYFIFFHGLLFIVDLR